MSDVVTPLTWRTGRAGVIIGVSVIVLGVATAAVALGEGGLRVGLGLVQVALGVGFVLVQGVQRVTAGQDGLEVRRGLLRQFLPYDEVGDIRPHEPGRPGSSLSIIRVDGTEVRTRLHPVEHRSLVRWWQERSAE